jgi:hypothetical protein
MMIAFLPSMCILTGKPAFIICKGQPNMQFSYTFIQ